MAKVDALAAFAEQREAITDWLADLSDDEWATPSALTGWDVRTLVAHLVVVCRGLGEQFPPPGTGRALAISQYVDHYREAAGWIADRAVQEAEAHTSRELLSMLKTMAIDASAGLGEKTVLVVRRAPVTVGDWVRTRVLDLVVHADDLSRSLPARPPVQLPRKPLGIAVRVLTGVLSEQAPGGAVEVRVPPYAAVQVIEGLRHTRGTPPNVVETDPVTWLRLATGRTGFADALEAGLVRASGTRADLTAYLPLLG